MSPPRPLACLLGALMCAVIGTTLVNPANTGAATPHSRLVNAQSAIRAVIHAS